MLPPARSLTIKLAYPAGQAAHAAGQLQVISKKRPKGGVAKSLEPMVQATALNIGLPESCGNTKKCMLNEYT